MWSNPHTEYKGVLRCVWLSKFCRQVFDKIYTRFKTWICEETNQFKPGADSVKQTSACATREYLLGWWGWSCSSGGPLSYCWTSARTHTLFSVSNPKPLKDNIQDTYKHEYLRIRTDTVFIANLQKLSLFKLLSGWWSLIVHQRTANTVKM